MAGKKIRLALVGVGNCACSLVQGIEFYKTPRLRKRPAGLCIITWGDMFLPISKLL